MLISDWSTVDLIVWPLFSVVRAHHLPTTLRTSALSLLGQCADTNAVALAPYVQELVSAMIDLVQVETVPVHQSQHAAVNQLEKAEPADVKETAKGTGEAEAKPGRTNGDGASNGASADSNSSGTTTNRVAASTTMDENPTEANAKFPPLRRAALHFLALLVRVTTARIYDLDDRSAFGLPTGLMKRGASVMRYVAETDRDDVVRVMAREAVEEIEELRDAIFGK